MLKFNHKVDKVYLTMDNTSYNKDIIQFIKENRHDGMEVLYSITDNYDENILYTMFNDLKDVVSHSIRVTPNNLSTNLITFCNTNKMPVCVDVQSDLSVFNNDILLTVDKLFVTCSPDSTVSVRDILVFLYNYSKSKQKELNFIISLDNETILESDTSCIHELMMQFVTNPESLTEFECGYVNSFLSRISYYKSYNEIFCRKNYPYVGRKTIQMSLDGKLYIPNGEFLCDIYSDLREYLNVYLEFGEECSKRYVSKCMNCPIMYICDGEHLVDNSDDVCTFNANLLSPILTTLLGGN